MPSYYHKGGTHVGVCPISHEYTILNFHYALKTPAGYKQKHGRRHRRCHAAFFAVCNEYRVCFSLSAIGVGTSGSGYLDQQS